MEKELQVAVQNLIPDDLFNRITAELDSKEEGAKMEKVLVRRIESKSTSLGLKTVISWWQLAWLWYWWLAVSSIIEET